MLFSTETSNDAAFSAFADALEDGEQQDERQAPSSPSSSSTAQKTKSWQAKLEDLLDPATNMADRQMLLSELLNSNQAIRESVLDALAKREVSKKWCWLRTSFFVYLSMPCVTVFLVLLNDLSSDLETSLTK